VSALESLQTMNLYLIGYRGCGKSTVAPLVAKSLGRKFLDADDLVEAKADCSIAEIFAQSGEPKFRELETKTIEELAGENQLVVALGGGAPMFEPNRQLIRSGKSIWLFAETSVLWERISSDKSTLDRRPNLTDTGGRAEVEELLLVRNPVYEACADCKLDVGSLSPEEVAERVVTWWESDDKN
jgi:shikimate kinase